MIDQATQQAIAAAVRAAIEEMGLPAFKKTSLFMSSGRNV